MTHSFNIFFTDSQFETTETEAGFVFLAILGSYCLTTPSAGILSDAKPEYMYQQMIMGTVIAAIGCQIIGPAHYLQGIIPMWVVSFRGIHKTTLLVSVT